MSELIALVDSQLILQFLTQHYQQRMTHYGQQHRGQTRVLKVSYKGLVVHLINYLQQEKETLDMKSNQITKLIAETLSNLSGVIRAKIISLKPGVQLKLQELKLTIYVEYISLVVALYARLTKISSKYPASTFRGLFLVKVALFVKNYLERSRNLKG